MDVATRAAQLAEGRSIESIAREAGKPASTVAYWVNKHGLTSSHAPRHAARGGIERERLQELVEQGLSIRAMAAELDVSYTTVRHWLARHGLVTPRARRLAETPARPGGWGGDRSGRMPHPRGHDVRAPRDRRLSLPAVPH